MPCLRMPGQFNENWPGKKRGVTMNARSITQNLAGRWHGQYGTAHCPAHDDKDPSFSIRDGDDGSILVHCHAGCGQAAVVLALKARGLWPNAPANEYSRRRDNYEARQRRREREMKQQADENKKTCAALDIWRRATVAKGSLIEIYLRARGISIEPPLSIKFAPSLKHRPTGSSGPAMVAAIQNPAGKITGIHRTYLTMDGRKKAAFSHTKMMLGSCAGGAVRLARATDELCVGEGIETMLSVQQETGFPCWAALSTSGLTALKLPRSINSVTICADADHPGEQAARDAAKRWKLQGRDVRIARPPTGFNDFNDALEAGANEDFSA